MSTVLVVLGALAACTPSSPANAPDDGTERFDPARESELQPFESFNGLRGPASSINGLRFNGEQGSFQAMVSAYEGGQDIVFLFMPIGLLLPPWLAACPRSPDNADEPQIQVGLEGVGDLSHNVLWTEGTWITSVGLELYAPLETLRFEICGATYELEQAYLARLHEHAKRASSLALGEAVQSQK
ncbi:MAG TPA: hypothetical protein VJU61_10765 [Polyangiaceae bacterium]|nr:hypothetical protein [Polyangiaceae bacterium]